MNDDLQKTIYFAAKRIEREGDKLWLQLQELQSLCQHPLAARQNKSSTGNWDTYADRYWIDCVCPDCGKAWQEDQ